MLRPATVVLLLAAAASAAAAGAGQEEEEDVDGAKWRLNAACSSASDCFQDEGSGRRAGAPTGMGCRHGRCLCHEGFMPWMGSCVARRKRGERCNRQIECTLSGDPNLHCVEQKDETEGVCLCRGGYVYGEAKGRCFPETYHYEANTRRPPHIKLEPRDREAEKKAKETSSVLVLEKNLEDIYSSSRKKQDSIRREEEEFLAPATVVIAALLLFGLCLCFWSARSHHRAREAAYAVESGRREREGSAREGVEDGEAQTTYRSAKHLEDGLSVGRGMMVIPTGGHGSSGLSPPEVVRGAAPGNSAAEGAGSDNQGFSNGDEDAQSHFTAQTEVCEASHAEYLGISAEEGVADERKEEGDGDRAEAAAEVAGYENNIRMIFKHSQEMSLTPSTDEADAEVAGIIYKTFSSNVDPLTARIANLPTPPPPPMANPKAGAAGRVVELVETDDCTSIDTTIPEDEVATFQRGLERQKELNMDDSIKEETEEEVTKNGSDTGSSSCKTPDKSDFVDAALKPVFSIS